VPYHTDEDSAEEAEEGDGCAPRGYGSRASTTSLSDGCWLVSGGSQLRNGV
jgi:hypothetical protein